MKQVLPGLLFAALWASASAATKFGLQVANPFALADTRFLIAGTLMLVFAYKIQPERNALPKGKEWRQLFIFSLLNTTIYLGAFVYAMKEVSAGIGSLSTATTPLFITLLPSIWLKRKLYWYEWTGILLGLSGVILAAYPLLHTSYVTVKGLSILLVSMFSVAAATVYYSSIKWQLSNTVINAWQLLLAGLSLLPITLFSNGFSTVQWNEKFWLSVGWLVIPVSIIGLQIWFYLMRKDAVHASLWLFLCPIFGFIYAAWLLKEPIGVYTYLGTLLVITGLTLAQHKKWMSNKNKTG